MKELLLVSFIYFFLILGIDVFLCMDVYVSCVCSAHRAQKKEGIGSSGIGITEGQELSCRCWELNLGLLKEQPVRILNPLNH